MTGKRSLRRRSEAGPRFRKFKAVSIVFLVIGSMAYLIQPASAVHDTGAFELDGNAVSTADGVKPDDWDRVCHQVVGSDCSTTHDTNGASAVAWTDDGGLSASIFTGGGSKDPQNISSWAWKNGGGLPDKDNLLHSFAARYSLAADPVDTAGGTGNLANGTACPGDLPGGGTSTKCEVLYFGSDRYDNSGDAQQGFWFFQNKVTLGTNAVGGGTGFSGVHKNGDLLVISDFSNGGTTSTIAVYRWDDTIPGNLKLVDNSASAKCGTAGLGDAFCGVVSPVGTTTSPWSFKDKSGNTGFANGEFYEGGVNLTSLGLGNECFSSVMSETRSSTSPTATLKDFVLGQLGQCGSTVVTTPKDGNGDAIPTDGLVLGTGGTVDATDSAVLTVSGIQTWDGTLSFHICGPIDPTATVQTCATGGTPVTTAAPNDTGVNQSTGNPILSDATTLNQLGKYCWRADFTPSTASAAAGLPSASDSTAGECFSVVAIPTTIATRQYAYPQDSAQVGAAAGGDLAGSVRFRLYDSSANCNATTPGETVGSDGLLYDSGAVTVSGASPQTVATTNTSARVDTGTAADLFWLVEYTSTNGSQLNSASTCTEDTSVTLTGNDDTIIIP